MKILVTVKRVIDAYVKIRVKDDGSGVETANVKMSMNPFDEIAVEEAVRLKEQGLVEEIVIVSIGSQSCQETIRSALALGGDRGILIEHEEQLEPLNIAKLLRVIVEEETPDLVLMGKQSIDGDNNQTGQMLAGLLNWPQGTFASNVSLDDKIVTVVREIDEGLETLQLNLPAIITVDLRLNQPRYLTLPNIMKAKRKLLKTLTVNDLAVTLKSHSQTLKMQAPTPRKAGIKVHSVQELVLKLSKEAGVI